MIDLKKTKRLLMSKATARKTTAESYFMVSAVKLPFIQAQYHMIIHSRKSEANKVFSARGPLVEVRAALERELAGGQGLDVLRKVAREVEKPVDMTGLFTESELFCLAALNRSSSPLRKICAQTGLTELDVLRSVRSLVSSGLVDEIRKAGGVRSFMLSTEGNLFVRLLRENWGFRNKDSRVMMRLGLDSECQPHLQAAADFTREEMLCMAALETGPKNKEQVAKDTGLSLDSATAALEGLLAFGALALENVGGPRYILDDKGDGYIIILENYSEFQDIRAHIKDLKSA